MIRRETDDGLFLITHGEHARLAWRIACEWGNAQFPIPEPRHDILSAVLTHDDGWLLRDSRPMLNQHGEPEAFTRSLVGAYSAFENIDLPAYLRVRAEATEAVAARNPFAAIIVSMHTVNLLTERADLSTIPEKYRALHAGFVEAQRAFQRDTAAQLHASPTALERAFRFLQTCDQLSLVACVAYQEPSTLRHRIETTTRESTEIHCRPRNKSTCEITPWPFQQEPVALSFEARRFSTFQFNSDQAYRTAFDIAPRETLQVTFVSE